MIARRILGAVVALGLLVLIAGSDIDCDVDGDCEFLCF